MNENELTKPSWDCSFWPTVDAQLFIVSHLRKTTFQIIVLTVHFPAVSSLVHWQEDNRSPRQPILIGYKEKELFSSINIKYFAEKTKWKKKCSWVTPKPLCLRYVNGLCDHKNRSQKTFQPWWVGMQVTLWTSVWWSSTIISVLEITAARVSRLQSRMFCSRPGPDPSRLETPTCEIRPISFTVYCTIVTVIIVTVLPGFLSMRTSIGRKWGRRERVDS